MVLSSYCTVISTLAFLQRFCLCFCHRMRVAWEIKGSEKYDENNSWNTMAKSTSIGGYS